MRSVLVISLSAIALTSSVSFAKEGDVSCGFVRSIATKGHQLEVALFNPKSQVVEKHVTQRGDAEYTFLTRAIGETKLSVCLVKDEFGRSLISSMQAHN